MDGAPGRLCLAGLLLGATVWVWRAMELRVRRRRGRRGLRYSRLGFRGGRGGRGDAGFIHGGGRGDGGDDFDGIAGLGGDGGLRGGEIERQELIDGEVLRGEDAVEAFQREGSFAVKEVRDVRLAQ